MDFSKLFSFQGRIGRREYWLTVLCYCLLYFSVVVFLGMLKNHSSSTVSALVSVAVIVPFFWVSLSFTVKRLHDTGRSGLWLLWTALAFLVPVLVAGAIAVAGVATNVALAILAVTYATYVLYTLRVVGFQRSDGADNAYGTSRSGSVMAQGSQPLV